MTALVLRRLGPADEEAFLTAHRAMAPESFEFGFDYVEGMPWEEYLGLGAAQELGVGLPANRVRAALLVGEVDGRLVGRVSIRFELTPWLAEVGGHIGYCVVPAERRRGYATEMLRQSLPVAHAAGIPRALLTCDEDNAGSRLVIERCGGVFERHAVNPDGPLKRRYWVPTTPG